MLDTACAVLTAWLLLINADRIEQRPPVLPLVRDQNLEWYAQWRAEDMAARNYYEHVLPEGVVVFDVMWALGYPLTPASENAWWCAPDAGDGCGTNQAHETLMASDGHRTSILDPSIRQVGLGAARNENDHCVYVQIFASDTPWRYYRDEGRW